MIWNVRIEKFQTKVRHSTSYEGCLHPLLVEEVVDERGGGDVCSNGEVMYVAIIDLEDAMYIPVSLFRWH
jgi:hypothetical protein